MQILTLGNDMLRQKAEKIEKTNGETQELIKKMFEILHEEKGIGLAAPQIGVNKRIFVIHVQDDEPRVFINPSFIETSAETCKYEEGCLSIPGVYADVIRSESVKMQAWNEKGKPFTIEAEGLIARVLQHEYDHLEGVLFIDRLDEDKRAKVLKNFNAEDAEERRGRKEKE